MVGEGGEKFSNKSTEGKERGVGQSDAFGTKAELRKERETSGAKWEYID
jgi:hypothetical protein